MTHQINLSSEILAVLRALRLIEHRAKLNGRQEITIGDIEWAIQELEKK
jgi:hypothetical protein